MTNPFADRLESFRAKLRERRLDMALVHGEANVRALTGVVCDNARLVVEARPRAANREPRTTLFTDFRYVPMVHRVAPFLAVRDLSRFKFAPAWRRIGYEGALAAARFLDLRKESKGAKWVDAGDDLLLLRAVKTPAEIAAVAAAEALNDRIWAQVQREIAPGMTEKEIQRLVRAYMNALGDGEAFETIVCAGANAAECHHVPDETPWRAGEPLLVDMGVKLDGVCADMTRCVKPDAKAAGRFAAEYAAVYAAVLAANRAAVAACRPGITGKQLDAVARRLLSKAGYGKAFGHSLGHGVGYEIHEWPVASKRSDVVLAPGMCVTIEPGVYLEGRLGVRIEDLVLVTQNGCEVLSSSPRE